ncbi:hypothetical protein ATANTOWER_022622, partial [Ataeniobius toweri]|nr:hypothetical protein [Ataeniobius toweri]
MRTYNLKELITTDVKMPVVACRKLVPLELEGRGCDRCTASLHLLGTIRGQTASTSVPECFCLHGVTWITSRSHWRSSLSFHRIITWTRALPPAGSQPQAFSVPIRRHLSTLLRPTSPDRPSSSGPSQPCLPDSSASLPGGSRPLLV